MGDPWCPDEEQADHEVPLSDQALSLLPERRQSRDLVFGQRVGPFAGFSNSKARLTPSSACGRGDSTMCATASSRTRREIGIDPHVIEACVNHQVASQGGIAGRYNAAEYREQKRAAMARSPNGSMALMTGEEPGPQRARVRLNRRGLHHAAAACYAIGCFGRGGRQRRSHASAYLPGTEGRRSAILLWGSFARCLPKTFPIVQAPTRC